ncbi:MAG TPA: GGDEF domain-containing protein [Pseudolabrys sp.]|jgi:diguanylate cyclase (GGDEF)-like protein|nr:GGDEF domain-containing protein [Pseudolabrys sp.]
MSDALKREIERLQRELTGARARIAELEARADVDPLLDILNRRGFERELARSLAYIKRYGTPAALLYIDLDGFKAINDRHGHAAGDELLEQVAGELTRHVRASDVVGRLGGDEFGVLMWNASKPQAMMRARDLEARIEAVGLMRDGVKYAVGASVGVTLLERDLDTGTLINAADQAMYARKKERRV